MGWFEKKLGSQTLLGKIVRIPFWLLPKSMTVKALFGPLKGYKWISESSNHGCWLGTYEMEQTKKLKQLLNSLPQNGVFYDIGANVGYYSLIAASLDQNIKVFAFEPSDSNLVFLKRHLELNNIQSVSVVPFAVGSTNREVGFNNGSSTTTGFVTLDPKISQKMVKQISIDHWCKENKIPPPELIKMDIEGAEFDALQGMKDTLISFRPKICLSTHGNEIHRRCEKFLTSLGYQIYPLDVESKSQILAI